MLHCLGSTANGATHSEPHSLRSHLALIWPVHEATDHRHRWPLGRRQRHDLPHAIRSSSATGTSTPAQCTARSAGRRSTTGIPLDDEAAVAALARRAQIVVEGGVVSIDGHDVTARFVPRRSTRPPPPSRGLPSVREVLVARQRQNGRAQGGVVMEGRDIGTVVFPAPT